MYDGTRTFASNTLASPEEIITRLDKMQQESPLSEVTSTSQDAHSTPPPGTEKADTPPKITRKSHKKSRAGCKNCKTRRIKVCLPVERMIIGDVCLLLLKTVIREMAFAAPSV